jgi:cation transport regulator
MAKKSSRKNSSSRQPTSRRHGPRIALSPKTKKQIDALPVHARHIYKSAHKNALKQYRSPSKRRGGKRQSREEVAHKVAWSAVKRKYHKEKDSWVSSD